MSQFPGTGLLDPPPDSNDPERDLARLAKDAGISRKQHVEMRGDAIRLTGRVLGWNSAEYDQAFLALGMICEEVWGIKQ